MKSNKNKLLLIISIFTFLHCKKQENENILGSWNVIHVYKNGKDILGNDKIKEIYRYRLMYIEKDIKQITIEIDKNENFYAYFELKKDSIIFSRSSMSGFDGNYSIKTTDSIIDIMGKNLKVLILESNSIKIYANRPTQLPLE